MPGSQGPTGATGPAGTDGINAYTSINGSGGALVPAVNSNVTLTVHNGLWMVPNQVVFIQFAGHYKVISKNVSGTSVVFENLGYTGNAAPGDSFINEAEISPAGPRGVDGTLTGAAGGSLSGTYPNPSIANGAVGSNQINAAIKDAAAAVASLRTLGTGAQQACAGNDSRLSDSRAPTGAAGGDLTGTYPNPTLATSAVSTGTYGTVDSYPTFTVDSKGRLIFAGAFKLTGIKGYRTTALTNANVTLVRGSDVQEQDFTGTLAGAVQIILSVTGAQEGDVFFIHLTGIVTTTSNTLTISDSVAGALKVYNQNKTVSGMVKAVYSGSQWKLFNTQAVAEV